MRTINYMDKDRITLTREDWNLLARHMRGENDGSWILLRNYLEPGQGLGEEDRCVAIMTASPGSLIIFITWLTYVLADLDDVPRATLEDVRYLADRVNTSTLPTATPIYYLPRVQVTR